VTAPNPYVLFPGSARAALEHYADVFDGEAQLHTYADFGRTDGPGEAIAHGMVVGPVELFGSDAGAGEAGVKIEGLMFSLLGAATPDVLHRWFDGLSAGGTVLDPLAVRPWGDTDGQVVDRFGLKWLIGYQGPLWSGDHR
jgi:PhnB protein